MDKQPITASEIAEFVFCPEAWRLSKLGHTSANRPALDAGTVHHTEKANTETIAGGSIAVGRVLIVLALMVLVFWLLRR